MLICMAISVVAANAQTWNGSASNDWDTPGNWTGGIPLPAGNVIIPTGAPRYPKLASNITINSINMATGSQLDVNGFTFTVTTTASTFNYIIGATLNNSSAVTDIVLNINTGGGGYATYFRSNTVNDNITINLTGSNQFNEAETAASGNTYNGNTSFNINGNLTCYLSHVSTSNFNGNLTVNRTVAGITQLFNGGATITGNFSYTNNTSGTSTLGTTSVATNIGGTVNIAANYTANSGFDIYRLINQTAGGSINIQNTLGFNIQKDTLKVTSCSVTGYTGNAYTYFLNNAITGNVTIADDATYNTGWATYIRNNTITGTSSFTKNGVNDFYEADGASYGNTYNGNTSFTATNSGLLSVSNGSASTFNGNLTVTRTVAGATTLFSSGAVITGNFSFTNNASGASTLGNTGVATTIAGTINIAAVYVSSNTFSINRLINLTTGGTINIQNTLGFTIQKDTLKVTSCSVTGYRGNNFAYFINNAITGNVTIADDATYNTGYATYIRNNTITGTSSFTNNGANFLYEADGASNENTYNGNTSFTATNSGLLQVSYGSASTFNGNLTVTRTLAGTTSLFNSGAVITGNFSFTNNTSGASTFGNTGFATNIGGTVNIAANYTSNSGFAIYRLINQTNGGAINIQNTTGFDIQKDTLKVTSMSLTGYKGNAYAPFYNNSLIGNLTIADDATYGGGYYTILRNNVITGNSSFTNNGLNVFYDADIAATANIYNGNTSFTATNLGGLNISNGSPSNYNGNLTVNRTASGTTQLFSAGAVITGNFSYMNNTSGITIIGNVANATNITGTINIAASYVSNNTFNLYRLINQTTGGTINIQNTSGFDIQKDTLTVISLSLTGYKGSAYASFYNNSITGNITIADDATYGGGYYTILRNNIITGNSSFTINGTNVFYDADVAGTANTYSGNLSYIKAGSGAMFIGAGDTVSVTQNLTLNSASGITLTKIRFNGSTDGVLQQAGTQLLTINQPVMDKTGTGKLTLGSPLTVTNTLKFIGGNIFSSAANNLIFPSGVNYSGASNNSYVDGPVLKTGNTAFMFPVGQVDVYAPISIAAPALNTDAFTAQYFKSGPQGSGYDTTQKDITLDHLSRSEYWILNRTTGASNVSVTLGWAPGRSGPVNSLPDLRVARWNGAIWKDEGNGGTTGDNTAGTIQSLNPVTNFSPFTLASSTNLNPLPVNLISFKALKNNSSVLLQWIIDNELNVAFYQIEKSNDGRNFTFLNSTISSNTTGTKTYTSTDFNPIKGINYYRLKTIDVGGTFTYSYIVKADFTQQPTISISPNPAKDYMIVNGAGVYTQIQIFDASGRLMKQINKDNDNRYNITGLNKGIYFIKFISAENMPVQKIVIE